MPIDDRIRRGLVSNADVPTPSVERHLERVRVRRRRRLGMRVAVAATATAAVVAVPWGVFQVLDRSAGDAVARPPGLAGTYRVVVGRGTADVRGRWTVTLGGDGSITLEAPAGYSGDLGAGESYEVSAPGELKTNLLVGAPGCQRADPPLGVYHFTATTSGVQFSVVDDSCPSRRTLLTGSWERIR